MAKGDRRTRRGKIWRGSYDVPRVKDKRHEPGKK
jgi:ribosomal small subunit protein bTHX